ncbi:MAG: hypothetical protein IPL90_04725 [Holophagales bacterium]|nr:hypothetical protein [Holophagales bacterium]
MEAASVRNAPSGLGASERRVLNPRPYRVFRKSYSVTEAKAGAVVLVGLAALAAWVVWRGAHPDPGLFADPAATSTGSVAIPVVEGRTAPDGPSRAAAARAEPAGSGPSTGSAPTVVDRGALPASLAAPGWKERTASRFDAENLYVKIDGRADFFLSRGFRSLTFVTLEGPSDAAVDVELYDLGSAENALGAFAAEKPPETKAASGGGTSWYVARNALFLARGGSYARAIGSDESPAVLAQLEALRKAFEQGIAAGEKPWTVALFADALGLPPDRLQYAAENAFSFGFAKNVTSATLDDGETELFVLPAGDAAKAKTLSAKFEEGFLSYGEKVAAAGASWVKDRYLSTFSRTVAAGTMVVGVRGAPVLPKGAEALAKLEKAVLALPPDVAKKAAAGPPSAAKPTGGGYE